MAGAISGCGGGPLASMLIGASTVGTARSTPRGATTTSTPSRSAAAGSAGTASRTSASAYSPAQARSGSRSAFAAATRGDSVWLFSLAGKLTAVDTQ